MLHFKRATGLSLVSSTLILNPCLPHIIARVVLISCELTSVSVAGTAAACLVYFEVSIEYCM